MRYMLLIHGSEDGWDALSDAERSAQYERYGKLQSEMEEHGYVAGDELEPRPPASSPGSGTRRSAPTDLRRDERAARGHFTVGATSRRRSRTRRRSRPPRAARSRCGRSPRAPTPEDGPRERHRDERNGRRWAMEYLLLIYGDEPPRSTPRTQRRRSKRPACRTGSTGRGSTRRASGRASAPRHDPGHDGARDGETVTTDGPFAETKEQPAASTSSTWPIWTRRSRRRRSAPVRSWDRSKCGRSRSSRRRSSRRPSVRRRPRVPTRVGTRVAYPDPRHRQLRRRGGRRPGRLPRRAGAVAPDGVPDTPGADRHDGTEPRDRPPPPRSRVVRRPRRWPGSRPSTWTTRTRSSTSGCADLHVLPPRACIEARRADPPDDRGTHDPRDRAGVPRARGDDRAAAGPGQAEDPRQRDPLPGPARRAPPRAARRRAVGPLSDLQRGIRLDGGELIREELCDEAIWLARVMAWLLPDEPEVQGCSR